VTEDILLIIAGGIFATFVFLLLAKMGFLRPNENRNESLYEENEWLKLKLENDIDVINAEREKEEANLNRILQQTLALTDKDYVIRNKVIQVYEEAFDKLEIHKY
jgi:hypothetical protein